MALATVSAKCSYCDMSLYMWAEMRTHNRPLMHFTGTFRVTVFMGSDAAYECNRRTYQSKQPIVVKAHLNALGVEPVLHVLCMC